MRLNQVTVGCRDYDASVAFYQVLGLTQIVDAPPRYARFETPTGETLSIHAADDVGTSTMVYFEVDNLDAVVEGLRASGMAFREGPADRSWGWREARLEDPAGNPICLFHGGANRRFPPWRMDGRTAENELKD